MLKFIKINLGVLFCCGFFVTSSLGIQGVLTGEDDYIYLKWDDFNPNYAAKTYCFGAHIVSWVVNGTEYLLLSNNTIFDDKTPLIGGISIVFPLYGNWTFGKDNGFSKNVRWDIWDCPIKDWDTGIWSMSFKTRDLVYTRSMWNYYFRMYLYLTINKNILTMQLKVHSKEEKKTFHFKLGFRNHIRTPDITQTTIKGLVGSAYIDNTLPLKLQEKPKKFQDREDVRITKWTDRLYGAAPSEVVVTNLGNGKNLKITTINSPDLVVWHPWNDHYWPGEQFAEDEYKHFVGIHTGVLREYIKLGPNETFVATQIFEIID